MTIKPQPSLSRSAIIYPGSFDPITNGHLDLIVRATHLFDKVIVAVALSEKKNTLFNLEERQALVIAALNSLTNSDDGGNFDDSKIEICSFSGLLTDFVCKKNVFNILRGLRISSDFEYEFQLTGLYRQLEPRIETIFLMPATEHLHISASMVREIAMLGGDVSRFVTKEVTVALSEKFS